MHDMFNVWYIPMMHSDLMIYEDTDLKIYEDIHQIWWFILRFRSDNIWWYSDMSVHDDMIIYVLYIPMMHSDLIIYEDMVHEIWWFILIFRSDNIWWYSDMIIYNGMIKNVLYIPMMHSDMVVHNDMTWYNMYNIGYVQHAYDT